MEMRGPKELKSEGVHPGISLTKRSHDAYSRAAMVAQAAWAHAKGQMLHPVKGHEGGGGGCWLAQLVERATLDLGVVGSSPMLGVEIA